MLKLRLEIHSMAIRMCQEKIGKIFPNFLLFFFGKTWEGYQPDAANRFHIVAMNCPAAPNGGITASPGQATGYQSEK